MVNEIYNELSKSEKRTLITDIFQDNPSVSIIYRKDAKSLKIADFYWSAVATQKLNR